MYLNKVFCSTFRANNMSKDTFIVLLKKKNKHKNGFKKTETSFNGHFLFQFDY